MTDKPQVQISDADVEAACDAYYIHWRTYGSFDRDRALAKMRAAIEALHAHGWRKVEEKTE